MTAFCKQKLQEFTKKIAIDLPTLFDIIKMRVIIARGRL